MESPKLTSNSKKKCGFVCAVNSCKSKGAVPCGRIIQSRKRTANYRKSLDFFLLQGDL